jgi:fructose-bisphosphate aldolase class I
MSRREELIETIRKICQPGKGILAADESSGTIGTRFASIGISNVPENRREYRDLLFTAPDLHNYVSGVITFEETLFDIAPNGDRLIQSLIDSDIVVGIKVDMGVKPLYGTHGESVTQGIDNLDARCKQYYNAGARFAKWRSVLKIDTEHNCPSDLAIHENATTLARYASICIDNGIVPIVEPEILMDGTHTIEKSREVAVQVLSAVYRELVRHHVDIECTLLKPNMVRTGVSSDEKTDYQAIAKHTISAFQQAVPVSMPGVVFLSGGMSEMEASMALNEINKYDATKPWRLTFSYGRALQSSVLKAWKGNSENRDVAQKMLLVRARANGMASNGMYEAEVGNDDTLHEENYVY